MSALGLVLLFAGTAAADPVVHSVLGNALHGETLRIRGESFGERPPAPLAFDDFESGALGGAPGEPWETRATIEAGTPRLDAGVVRRGSAHSLLCDFSAGNDVSSIRVTRPTDEVFLSFWRQVRITGSFTAGWTTLSVDGASATGHPSFTHVLLSGGTPSATWIAAASDDVSCALDSAAFGGEGDGVAELRRWIREDYWLRASSPGTVDGWMEIWRDHVPEPYAAYSAVAGGVVPVGPAIATRCGDDGWSAVEIGATWSHDPGGDAAVYYDDVYLDETPARVEIGNGPFWETVTISEIQPTTSWSDGEVEVTLHIGALYVGAGYWLYVFDSENRPSEGFPIQLGATYRSDGDAGTADAGGRAPAPVAGCGCRSAGGGRPGWVACLWAVFWAGWRNEKANRNRHRSARSRRPRGELSRGVPRGCAGHR